MFDIFLRNNNQILNNIRDIDVDFNKDFNHQLSVKLMSDLEYLRLNIRDSLLITDSQKEHLLFLTGRSISSLIEKIRIIGLYSDITNGDICSFDNKKNIIYLGFKGGLCNRLRAIAGLKVIANLLGCNFYWTWTENVYCTGSVVGNSNHISWSEVLQNGLNNYLIDNVYPIDILYKKFNSILQPISFDDVYRDYVFEAKHLLNFFISGNMLHKKVHDFIKYHGLDNFTSMHIRRTDFVEHFQKVYPTEKLPDIDDYISYAKKNLNGKKFFLSTDDINVRQYLMNKCSDQVCMWHHNTISDRLRQTTLNDALLDLAILSMSSNLVITPHSSFSSFVANSYNIPAIRLT